MRKLQFLVLFTAIFSFALLPHPAMAKMKINMASAYGPGAPVHFGLEKFKELVEQRSSGEMEVLIHLLGTMGGERDIYEALSSGGVETAAMGSGDIAIFHPEYLVFEVPYVIRDVENFFGPPVVQGTFDGNPVPISMNWLKVAPLRKCSLHAKTYFVRVWRFCGSQSSRHGRKGESKPVTDIHSFR